MAIKHMEEDRDADISRRLVEQIRSNSTRKIRLMEVCGTHTVSIFRSGIRSLLPDTISLLSGPGCPVCVTDQKEIDAFIALARFEDVILTTFGDLMRVPGTETSLQKEKAEGCDIRVVYSTMDAIDLAVKYPEKKVVFLGVGFETTAPTIAAAIQTAKQMNLNNFSVFSAHKTVPSALEALMSMENVRVDGFILPGHVSVIIGRDAYKPFFDRFQIPCAIAGFEPADILQAIDILVSQIETKSPELTNAYGRAVTDKGNPTAERLMQDTFEITDVAWRGIGIIPGSGLKIGPGFGAFDAEKQFTIDVPVSEDPKGCACGDILIGVKKPFECPLYKTRCTPMDPVGPCMVSSEGTCAAYYKYHE
ncbi:MAG: hydrogenase formation protein HypD [Desulfobacterales bacterium]|nr:hydrogenase formation protein HypD [Desulfobacterales bacterium]MDX2510976.1 hydrogenase formation protein HypD [Desulfobacterales bacterium]